MWKRLVDNPNDPFRHLSLMASEFVSTDPKEIRPSSLHLLKNGNILSFKKTQNDPKDTSTAKVPVIPLKIKSVSEDDAKTEQESKKNK